MTEQNKPIPTTDPQGADESSAYEHGFHQSRGAAAVWVERPRGGYGYRFRNLARVLRRTASGRVVVRCYSWWEHRWVEKTVVAANVLPPSDDEVLRLRELERKYPPPK